jgi:hypothetical protein
MSPVQAGPPPSPQLFFETTKARSIECFELLQKSFAALAVKDFDQQAREPKPLL